MKRIVAIDYGSKRVGLAVTDPLQMFASPLTTVHSKDAIEYLKKYRKSEEIECFVIGEPKRLDNTPSESAELVKGFINLLKKHFPGTPVYKMDERFTSSIAKQSLVQTGLKKKDRQNKNLLDSVSAALILQQFLELHKR